MGERDPQRNANRARTRPHPLMVNLTTASLEPAPLSSGWKSGSLPTGFTPTILTDSPAGRPRRFRLQNLRRKAERGPGRAAGGRGLDGSGYHDVSSPELGVPSHAREQTEPRGRRRAGRGARGTRRAAPSSHRAEGASALARLTSFPRLPFACSPEPCATGVAQALALAQTQTQTQAVRVGGAAGVLNLIP